MTCMEFREDLRNGMTINDALIKHNLSLKNAVDFLQYKQQRPKNKIKTSRKYMKCGERYIMQRGEDSFCIRKNINGKTRMFGTYTSLEDAIRMREALKIDGWHQTHVDSLCEKLRILRKTGHHNCKVRYH